MKFVRLYKRRNQKGFTLIELSIALTLSAIMMVMVLDGRSKDLKQLQVKSEVSWVLDVVKDIQQGFSTESGFGRLNNAFLASVNSIPKAFIRGTGSGIQVSNGFGGAIQVAPRALAGRDQLALTYTGITREVCSSFISEIETTAIQKGIPLFALVGSSSDVNIVPPLYWDVGNGLVSTSSGYVMLKQSPKMQLDIEATGRFCNQKTTLKSITLVKFWNL